MNFGQGGGDRLESHERFPRNLNALSIKVVSIEGRTRECSSRAGNRLDRSSVHRSIAEKRGKPRSGMFADARPDDLSRIISYLRIVIQRANLNNERTVQLDDLSPRGHRA